MYGLTWTNIKRALAGCDCVVCKWVWTFNPRLYYYVAAAVMHPVGRTGLAVVVKEHSIY